MGTWGADIYDSDFSLDIKEEYLSNLRTYKDNDIATKKIKEDHKMALLDTDDCPIFWISLANTQWEYGRLLDTVKTKALEIISKEIDEEYWGILYDKRIQILKKLSIKLNGPQPKQKRVVRRKQKLKPGDIFKFTGLIRYFPDGSSEIQFFYGRYLTSSFVALYSTGNIDADIFRRERAKGIKRSQFNNQPELKDFYDLDIIYIGSTMGFEEKKYRVIGNLPLEDKFKKPIYFYHRSTSENICRVFDIWKPNEYINVDIKDLDVRIPQWTTKMHDQILQMYGFSQKEVNMGYEYARQLKGLLD